MKKEKALAEMAALYNLKKKRRISGEGEARTFDCGRAQRNGRYSYQRCSKKWSSSVESMWGSGDLYLLFADGLWA